MTTTPSSLKARLEKFGQQHLLSFWDELSPQEQQSLSRQIEDVDFDLIRRLFQQQGSSEDWAAMAARAEPPAAFRLDGAGNRFSASEAASAGEAALRAGKLGVILVAGGQGTRLGFDAPKGTFSIGPVSGATLFQILVEKLLAVSRRFGVRIPLYLMTSPATDAATHEFFAQHDRFGLPPEDLHIFCQGTMPAVDAQDGRLLLAEKHALARSPDGHGGMLQALVRSDGMADCQRRGIQQLFYLQVDNPLAVMCDPVFIGYHLLARSEMSTQVVAKQNPLDRVGNFATVDGQTRIIEYSDLPDDVAQQRNPDGSLKLWAGNSAVHVLDLAFLARMSETDNALPFHAARKKVPYIDASGNKIEPQSPNAIKFERFIFDLLPQARGAIAVEVDEQTVFAPVKNAPGEKRDTPESVQQQMIRLHRRWLTDAGATVPEGVAVEISPLFANEAEELNSKIAPGLRINEPTYLH